ncbi:hypothetical protein KSP39_PZI007495 [Platanthera zijinensis]|uniref:Uncharacterized protein n=1 Tax=Platanthera zijinensis TaxID=2320716 RepID=A0AAP0G9L3_9ASPA
MIAWNIQLHMWSIIIKRCKKKLSFEEIKTLPHRIIYFEKTGRFLRSQNLNMQLISLFFSFMNLNIINIIAGGEDDFICCQFCHQRNSKDPKYVLSCFAFLFGILPVIQKMAKTARTAKTAQNFQLHCVV